ncbi:MAG: Fis family transcriptional regulator [Proteobacteria bacterium]|nr:Fis family transcriptional regulator [Pseudomonadota bacterium]
MSERVRKSIKRYYSDLNGEKPANVYDLVLQEVEPQLLLETLRFTNFNQSKTSEILGINRGTLRKKLKRYDLLKENV